MSNPLKKIAKKIKKVFKRVVKTVKKIAKSKIFKAVVIAAAIYFTAGAAAGALGASGAATAATGATAVGSGTSVAIGTAAGGATVAGATGAASTGSLIGGIATGAKAVGTAVAGMTPAQSMLASAALSTGAPMIASYAADKEAKEARKERDRNGAYQLDLKGMYGEQLRAAGGVETDESGRTVYNTPSSQPSIANIERAPAPTVYNSASDSWSPVQRVANRTAQQKATA